MNFSKEKIINLIRPDYDRFKKLTNPFRDWLIASIFFTVVIVAVIGVNLYFFFQINNEDLFFNVVLKKSDIVTEINQEELNNSINYLNNKEIKLKSLKDKKPFIIDPSL